MRANRRRCSLSRLISELGADMIGWGKVAHQMWAEWMSPTEAAPGSGFQDCLKRWSTRVGISKLHAPLGRHSIKKIDLRIFDF